MSSKAARAIFQPGKKEFAFLFFGECLRTGEVVFAWAVFLGVKPFLRGVVTKAKIQNLLLFERFIFYTNPQTSCKYLQ